MRHLLEPTLGVGGIKDVEIRLSCPVYGVQAAIGSCKDGAKNANVELG